MLSFLLLVSKVVVESRLYTEVSGVFKRKRNVFCIDMAKQVCSE